MTATHWQPGSRQPERWHGWDRQDREFRPDALRVAIVAYEGVLADETESFRAVLGRIPGATISTVGVRRGIVGGPGGAQRIDATFDATARADVVVVPGGLGSHRHPEIALWLLRVEPRWVLTSSTGSALLATTGLLRGRTAATHWLAGPLLERHGVTVSSDRLVVDGPYVTCAGLASAYDAAFVVVAQIGGPVLVREIGQQLRDTVHEAPELEAPIVDPPRRVRRRDTPRTAVAASRTVEVELEVTERRRS